jgi:hypothetical protein
VSMFDTFAIVPALCPDHGPDRGRYHDPRRRLSWRLVRA